MPLWRLLQVVKAAAFYISGMCQGTFVQRGEKIVKGEKIMKNDGKYKNSERKIPKEEEKKPEKEAGKEADKVWEIPGGLSIESIREKMELAAERWLETEPQKKTPGWSVSCFFMGCMEAYKMTGKELYLKAALNWAEENHWQTDYYGKEDYAKEVLEEHFTEKGGCGWKYADSRNYLNIHADLTACGQVYLELFRYFPEKADLRILLQVMEFNADDPHPDYWWWADAVHMGLYVYHKVSQMQREEKYARKAHQLYLHLKEVRKCYDTEEYLWYRDERFLPEKMRTQNGRKVFWSRGNGWVYAGLIRTLGILEEKSPYYHEYKKVFLEMTQALIPCQKADGFWPASLKDPLEYPEKETSGTLLFLYAILRAIRLGILDERYLPFFIRGFRAVNEEVLQKDGTVGWVQGVADRPGKTEEQSSKDYAVGYYLMVCCEWIAWCRENTSRYITPDVRKRILQLDGKLQEAALCAGVPVSDRPFWEKAAAGLNAEKLIADAEGYGSQAFPEITEEIYFEFRSGKMPLQSDKILFTSMRRLEQTVLAECLENKGRFLPYIEQGIRSVCSRKSWVRPNHDKAFDYSDYRGIHGQIDLYSSSVAWRLAVCDACIGEKLDPALRRQMKEKVRTKVLDVFFTRLYESVQQAKVNGILSLYWLDAFDNWLAVCLSGVVCAGIYFGTEYERLFLIALYEKQIQNYRYSLKGGYCVEGLAYWGYGFGKFLSASDTIFRITGGGIDLLKNADFYKAALFGFRIGITEKVYPSTADCGFGTEPLPLCMNYIARRAGLAYADPHVDYTWDCNLVMMMLNWEKKLTASLLLPSGEERLRTWFQEQGILICRNAERDFGIYIQGGTNHVPHNHNDLGAFILASGEETFVADPGFSVYNDITFSKERYSIEVLSSYGHSVPVVAGCRQGPAVYTSVNTNPDGKRPPDSYEEVRYRATVTDLRFGEEEDSITYDLKAAYDCDRLKKLYRKMTFFRKKREVILEDTFLYDREETFETAVITYLPAEIQENNTILLKGDSKSMRLEIQTQEAYRLSVNCVRGAVTGNHDKPAYPLRIGIKIRGTEGKVTLRFSESATV